MRSSKSRTFQPSATPVTILAHLLAVAVTTLVLLWLLHVREGLAFGSHNKLKIFNLHPLLMIIGFILIGGEAIMVYKTVSRRRRTLKTGHVILNITSLVSGGFGMYAVFKFQHEQAYSNMYTLHSWLGVATVFLYAFQWVFGFMSYMFPGAEKGTKASYLPWHTFCGLGIFYLAICTALMGLAEKFLYLGLFRNQEALIVNSIGLLILLFGICVGLGVFLPKPNY